MGHQLNIKGEEAYRLASELAALRGESLTAAVTRALKETLERDKHESEVATKVADLMAIAAEFRALVPPGVTSDHSWLYDDETGAPR